MIALKLTNVKACMSHLLLMDTFDSFLLIEGEIMTFNTFKIDGFIQKNFYTSEELEQMGTLPEYAYWKQLREYCFSLIKGKKTPLGFRFVPRGGTRCGRLRSGGYGRDPLHGERFGYEGRHALRGRPPVRYGDGHQVGHDERELARGRAITLRTAAAATSGPPALLNCEFNALLRGAGMRHIFMSSYNPRQNGKVERLNGRPPRSGSTLALGTARPRGRPPS